MKRSVRNGLIVAAALAVAGAMIPIVTTTANAAGNLSATFTVDQDWGSGWGANYKITNGTSSTINGWTIEFDLPAGGTDQQLVGRRRHPRRATTTRRRTRAGHGTLAPGASVQLRLQRARARTAPTSCKHQRRGLYAGHPHQHAHPTPTPTADADHATADHRHAHTRPRRTTRRPAPAARRSSATSPSGASTAATTTSRTSRPAARRPS